MQKSTWLWAFLPYLHWFGSVVDGAVVLTPSSNLTQTLSSNLTYLVRPHGLHSGLTVIDKERGSVLQAENLFLTGIILMRDILAPEDFAEFIPSQAWSLGGLVLGVTVSEQQGGLVQRAVVLNALYFIFLLMKEEDNFRSGVFEIQFLGITACEMVIFSTASSGLQLAPSFAHVTPLPPLLSSIANNTNNSSQVGPFPPPGMEFNITTIMPYLIHPMDELGELINLVDMLFRIAQPPASERIQKNIESIVPTSGEKLSLNLTQDDVPITLTYGDLIWAVAQMCVGINFGPPGQAFTGRIYLDKVYQGELTLVPSNPSKASA